VSQAVAQDGNKASLFRALSIVDSISAEHKPRSLSKIALICERFGESDLALSSWLAALKTVCVRKKANYYDVLSDGVSGLSALRKGETLVKIDKRIRS
jgi:hypothetical protein